MTPQASAARPANRRRFVIGALIVLVLVAGAGALVVRAQLEPGDPVAGVSEIAVRDNTFAPAAIAVPAGTTVTWTWDGAEEHNVVGPGFEAPVQAAGTFAHTFAEPGAYPYECTLHFMMRGEVVVE